MCVTSLEQDTSTSALSTEASEFKAISINASPASPSFQPAVIWAYAILNLLAEDELIA